MIELGSTLRRIDEIGNRPDPMTPSTTTVPVIGAYDRMGA